MDYIKQYKLLYKRKKNYGKTSIKLYDMLKKIINDLNISSVLDYGCGKSKLLDLIKKNKKIKIYRYDPAIKKYSKLTKNKVNLVICTDVLQHVPLYDLDRVLKEIKSKGIYILFYIKCTNHKTKLPNKTYANCTVYDKKWWLEKLSNYYDDIKEIKISDLTSVCFIMKGENIMNYDINIREEVFGGTLMDVKTGKRVYITKKELKNILNNNIFPKDLQYLNKDNLNIKFTKLTKKVENMFSFFDIVYLELTRACNLKCIHCLNNSGIKQKDELTKEDLLKLIKNFSSHGVQEIRFTGGEPLLFNGIYDLIRFATEEGICTSLGTNGTLVTKEVAKKLKESGLKKVVVSIDGNKKTHDKIRGKKNYQKAMHGLKYLQKNGINVRVNSVIMKSNMEDVIKLAKKMSRKKITIFIRRFISSGRGKHLENNMLNKKDYDYVRNKLQKELTKKTYVNGHYLRNDEGVNSRIKLPFEIRGCKAGQRAITILPNGDVNLCGFLAAQDFPKVGNIKEIDDFLNFWILINKNDHLLNLRNNLDKYNKLLNVQETYCLAYIANYLKDNKL
ncbi:radical SAM domain-containing protein [Mycoplasma sp. CAG:611]|nr:radical SAM domain-containing protein [Mycoplasma sp. CAG:611]